MTKRIVVAVTGASGGVYALRLLRALVLGGHQVEAVLSKYGRHTLAEEVGLFPRERLSEFLTRTCGLEVPCGAVREHDEGDLAAPVSSGSVRTDGMVIVPCSMKTLSAVASGSSSSLISRAADVTLKEGRPLILVPRETPLNLIQMRNLVAAAEAGARIVPAMPAFYQKPATFDDLGDFIAARVLCLLGIDQDLVPEYDPIRPGCSHSGV